MLTDERWAALEPLVEACWPHAKVPPSHLRRTMAAIVWRHENGAKWRAIPTELGPCWTAAQTLSCGTRLGVWERLLSIARERGVTLGTAFLDGTALRAHQKAPGAPARKARPRHRDRAAAARRSGVPAAAYASRSLAENLWARLKEWRPVPIRPNKTAAAFLGVLHLAAALDWLRR